MPQNSIAQPASKIPRSAAIGGISAAVLLLGGLTFWLTSGSERTGETSTATQSQSGQVQTARGSQALAQRDPVRAADAAINSIIPSIPCSWLDVSVKGGAGNLMICEVLLAHFKKEIFDLETKMIDPFKLDSVARMGGDFYCRANGEAIFKVPKPLDKTGIGVDQIPERIRNSKILTGNDLGMLGNVERLPTESMIADFAALPFVQNAIASGEEALHVLAKKYLDEGRVEEAWKILLSQIL